MELPNNWEIKSIEELPVTFQKGVNAKEKGDQGVAYHIPSGSNFPNGIKLEKTKKISKEVFHSFKETSILKEGDILFNSGGVGTLGRVGYFSSLDLPAVPDSFIILIRTNEKTIKAKYLYYWFQTIESKILIEENTQGTTGITSIKSSAIKSFKLPLAPITEQKKIVAKLDSLMERINVNKERLDKIPQILKRFRQSVLAAAVAGKLTEDWREENKVKEKWRTETFEACINELRNGLGAKPSLSPPGVPILRISSVRPGSVDFNDVRYYTAKENNIDKYYLNNTDLLFTRYNGSIEFLGVCALVNNVNGKIVYPDKLMRVRVNNEILNPNYCEYFFQSETARSQVLGFAKSSAGQNGISGGDLKKVIVTLPPIKEQEEIVSKIESLFTFADKIEERYTKAKQQLDKLPQSILAKAFRGELV